MKITAIEKLEVFEIKTDTDEYFRRIGIGGWERFDGNLWEQVFNDYRLEEKFQNYLKEHKL